MPFVRFLAHRTFLLPVLAALLAVAGCAKVEDDEPPPAIPTLEVSDIRAGVGESIAFPINVEHLPEGTTAVELVLDLRLPRLEVGQADPGRAAPRWSEVSIEPAGEIAPGADHAPYRIRVEAPEGQTFQTAKGTIATVNATAPMWIQSRRPLRISEATATLADGTERILAPDARTIAVTLISGTNTYFLAAFLAAVVGAIFLLAQVQFLQGFFRFLPPLIWMYFVPMFMTTLGITPDISPFYSPFMSVVVLPAILVLLLIPSDVRRLAKLGPKAVAMVAFATTGIIVGATVSFSLFLHLFPDSMPEDAWKGIGALAGSWIGGSANLTAVFESVGTPPGMLGPIIVVDTVLVYSWLGLLIALSAYQARVDKRHGANTKVVEEISTHLKEEHEANARCPSVADIAFMVGIALLVSQVCLWLGRPIFGFFTDTLGFERLGEVVSAYGWGILLITAAGLLLSMTPARRLDYSGASSLGYMGLYLLLTTYGARADLRAVTEVPIFFGIGIVWMLIHIAFVYTGLRLLKAPLFLGATSSMANMGGTASAPVVAASYNQSMAPVGLLMAILCSTLGTPLAFLVAGICLKISGG